VPLMILLLFFLLTWSPALLFSAEFLAEQTLSGDSANQEITNTPAPKKNKSFSLRVLLDEPLEENDSYTIDSSAGIVLVPSENLTEKKSTKKPVIFSLKQGKILLNNKEQKSSSFSLFSRSGKEYLIYKGKRYNGSFIMCVHNGLLYLMNLIDSQDYVSSVLHKESWPGWPHEFNKVLAICCRTYALEKVIKARTRRKKGSAKVPYDIKNSTIHQTYQGIHSNEKLNQAVAETAGIIITYQAKPIEAMFDACCGGALPAKMAGVNFTKAPYLARTTVCSYCKKCPNYRWQAVFSSDALKSAFGQDLSVIKKIKKVTVSKKDGAGYVQELLFSDKHKTITLTGKRVYNALNKKIKSMRFTVQAQGNTFVFNGQGYGHGLGLCQWGAREMVEKGSSYKKVLAFYYPHTTLMRVVE
jgi:stage II sporulation protein D